MTTQFPMKTKCPKCGEESVYLEVLSVFIRTQEDVDRVKLLMNYEKTCGCGEVFDMSKNKVMLDHDIVIEMKDYMSEENIKYLNAMIEGFNSKESLEEIEKKIDKILKE